MKTIIPSYYHTFRCIADRCRHSCCIGWEIDIDAETYERYRGVEGPFGERLRTGICGGDTPCFRLTQDERCTFFREDGLCDIICTLGEEHLCDICREHPRFYTENGEYLHAGLGLCCEEVCRLVLCEPVAFLDEETGESVPFDCRVVGANERYTPSEWAAMYRGLERLDPRWDAYLDRLEACRDFAVPTALDAAVWERLLAYFLFRHTHEYAAFCVHAVRVIQTICAAVDADFDELCEICRLYSSEIEYSDDNIQYVYEKTADA